MTHAVFLDAASLGSDLTLDAIASEVDSLTVFDHTSDADVVARCTSKQAVFTNKVSFSAEVMDALPELRYIGLTATGSDPIDIEAARERNIAVSNIVAYCTASVTQHVFAVLLALTHNITRYARDVRNGKWQQATQFCMLDYPVRELHGLTLGIFGYGELGHSVATLARAFGMNVIIAARDASDERDDRVPHHSVFERADVISLHCPLTPTTRHMINASTLALMKPTAVLINTARGGLVDAAAMAAALQQGQIGGAGLDVLEPEPPQPDNPLLALDLPNLMITPHTAWAAREARQRAIQQAADNYSAFRDGRRSNRVDEARA